MIVVGYPRVDDYWWVPWGWIIVGGWLLQAWMIVGGYPGVDDCWWVGTPGMDDCWWVPWGWMIVGGYPGGG